MKKSEVEAKRKALKKRRRFRRRRKLPRKPPNTRGLLFYGI